MRVLLRCAPKWRGILSKPRGCMCQCNYSSEPGQPRVAVVGSGPAGFYTAQQILKGHSTALVDIYEKLPVPFGLVRFGVAPDHPEVKNVINTFTQTATNERCTFIGNVTVGADVSLHTLRNAYSAVVLAYGADDDKTFGLPGENLPGILSARSFVGWYNGLPQDKNLSPNLKAGDTAVVLGQGNVAVDVARMLLTPVHILKKTDITESAIQALSESTIRRVFLVGRRGPLQVAFTTAELREMVRLQDTRPIFNKDDFQDVEQYIPVIPRTRKRLTELMIKTALKPDDKDTKRWQSASKEWHLKFLRSPKEFLSSPDGSWVEGVRFRVNTLEGEVGPNQKAVPTDETEDINCGLVFRSIGYRSIPLESDSPFDPSRGVVPNQQGRVPNHKGLYCSGWVKRGPIGVIVSTMNDGFETGKVVVDDLNNGMLDGTTEGKEAILKHLNDIGVEPVYFSDWTKIDQEEARRGEGKGKPREKVTDICEMMDIAKS